MGPVRKKGVSALKLAATYIGTIVGAGFATGQEVLQFFNRFGIWGAGGLILVTLMFITYGYIIMDLGKDLHARSHVEIIRFSGGEILGTFTDIIITVFLFGSFTAMIAGTGALFEQQLGIAPLLGNLIMAALSAITVMTGISGVINSISFVVPFLLVSVLGISVHSLLHNPIDLKSMPTIDGHSGIINHWLPAAILYVSYNTVSSIAILGPLGANARNRKAVWIGAVLGGLGLGVGAFMIFTALSGHIEDVHMLEVPMGYIAGRISPLIQALYAVILIAEVYTTAVSSLFGFASRIINRERKPADRNVIILCISIAALTASQLGFSNLVRYLYPLVGYCGVAMLGALAISAFCRKTPFSSEPYRH